MTALEYMEKQLRKNSQNYAREFARDAPEEVLNNIMEKMLYYAAAAEALEKVNGIVHGNDCAMTAVVHWRNENA